jgi:hypothetical protein
MKLLSMRRNFRDDPKALPDVEDHFIAGLERKTSRLFNNFPVKDPKAGTWCWALPWSW